MKRKQTTHDEPYGGPAPPRETRLAMLRPLRRRTEGRERRRGVYLLPSAMTVGNMFCGYACVLYALRGELETAAPYLGIAMVLDMLDGRIARLTGTTTKFGLEFDSLADVISFGVAPAVLMYVWGLAPLNRLGWAVGFIFVTAAALRLARFNIQTTNVDKRYFVGMPSPAAAVVPAATVYAFPAGIKDPWQALLAVLVVLIPAFLMVSTIRFRSFKTLDLKARSPRSLALVALIIAVIFVHPRYVLLVLAYSYLASAFVGMAVSRWKRHGDRGRPATHAPVPDESDREPS
jgi:CDP-diacylglycerol--serine O-phosphatidyltransferase